MIIKKIFKNIVAKNDIKLELSMVLIEKDAMVATDAFKLLKVNADALKGEDEIVHSVLASKLKKGKKGLFSIKYAQYYDTEVLKTLKLEDGDKFPDYQRALPTEKELADDKLYTTITLNPKYLADLAQAIADTLNPKDNKYKYSKNYAINLKVRIDPMGKYKPIVLERLDKKAIGVLMPINND